MADGTTGNVIDLSARRRGQNEPHQDQPQPTQSMQEAVDSLSLSMFGFWPGAVWLPIPFDTRDSSRDRS